MKKLLILLFIGAFSMSINAQNNEFTIKTDPNTGVFEFETKVVDYGTIVQNSDGNRAFKFKNVGKSPIIITKVKGSCGCTVPTRPDKPIMPGEAGEIGVRYATNRLGAFTKTVTVTSNASEQRVILRIKGVVVKDGADAMSLEKQKSTMSTNQ
jgi:hypothetical protein